MPHRHLRSGRADRRVLAAMAAVAAIVALSPAGAAAAQVPPSCAEVSAFGAFSFADRALAVSTSGDVYTSSGTTVTGRSGATVVFTATAPPDFVGLIDMAVTTTDEVVALDASGQVVRFAPDGGIIGTIDVGDINLQEASIAVHPDGRIWVADPFTDTLRAFMPDGSLDIEVDGGTRPGDVEIAPNGEVLTTDGFERVIRWHSDTGERLREAPIGHVNTGDVEIAVDIGGRVYLSDPFTDTVQVFTPSGEHLLTVDGDAFAPPLERPITVEALPTGGAIVGDSSTGASHVVTIATDLEPVLVSLEASASPQAILVGEVSRVSVRVSATTDCSIGPFEIDHAVPPGLTVENRSTDDEPWEIDLLNPTAPDADLWLDVVADAGGSYDVSFELTGPGVISEVTASIVATEPVTTTTTPPASTTTGAPTGQLPVTGPRATTSMLALSTFVVGLVLARRARRPEVSGERG